MSGLQHVQRNHMVRVQHAELILVLFVVYLLEVVQTAWAPCKGFGQANDMSELLTFDSDDVEQVD